MMVSVPFIFTYSSPFLPEISSLCGKFSSHLVCYGYRECISYKVWLFNMNLRAFIVESFLF